MADFPILRTGAVAQYPFSSGTLFRTVILNFVDGSEQRYSDYGQPLRAWTVQLDQLDEGELATVRQFFREQAGMSGRFTFTDPVTGTSYPNCSFAQSSLTGELKDTGRSATRLVIKTNP